MAINLSANEVINPRFSHEVFLTLDAKPGENPKVGDLYIIKDHSYREYIGDWKVVELEFGNRMTLRADFEAIPRVPRYVAEDK